MRKITYFLSLCLLLLMGSTTALADDYTVKKLKSIGESELTSVDDIRDGQTFVLLSTYNNKYLKFDMATKKLVGVSNLDVNDNNASLSVVTFHKQTVEGDENVYYTLEMPGGYYFPKFINQSGFSLVQANDALFQIMAITDVWSDGSNTETEGAARGKHCFFIKSKDSDAGNDVSTVNAYLNWNAGNKYAFGYGAFGHGRFALIPVETEGTVTNYDGVTFTLKDGDNTLYTSTGRAWEGAVEVPNFDNLCSAALFDITPNGSVSSTNKEITFTPTLKENTFIKLSSASDRKWYSLQTRKSVYDAGQLVADGDAVKCHGAGFNDTDIASYEQFENGLWSFELSGYGVKIYNKGKQQYLKSTDGTGGRVTFDVTGTVFYMGSVSDGTFNLNTGNANSYVGSHDKSVVISGGNYTGEYLSVWTNVSSHNDPGSTFTPTSVEDILAIGSAAFDKTTPERSYTENGVLKKGCYDAVAKASVSEATSFAEMEKRINEAAANVSPEEGAYYLIRNVNCGAYGSDSEGREKYLTTTEITCDTKGDVQASVNGQSIDLSIKRLGGTSAFVPRLWKFVKTTDGKYNLLNANTNSYVNVVPKGTDYIAQMLTKDNQGQKDAYEIYTTDDAFKNPDHVTNDSTTMFVMSSTNATGNKLLNAQLGIIIMPQV